ncbi:MAG TPA: hypothetical protein VFR03_16675, partial [Thermoanaerobaculia bacterium]|nr:hypothetical protein [Thermoanaerobaculia bacterium]
MTDPAHPVVLDGSSLTLEDLARVARDPRARVEIHPKAWARVEASRAQIEAIAARYAGEWEKDGGRPVLEYGVTTG